MPTAFISFSHHDRDSVLRLARDLGRAGLDVWCDKAVEAGNSYSQLMRGQLENAYSFIHVLVPKSLSSNWLHHELNAAFISYSHHDHNHNQRLAVDLKRPGIDIWWGKPIETAMLSFVATSSPAATSEQARWPRQLPTTYCPMGTRSQIGLLSFSVNSTRKTQPTHTANQGRLGSWLSLLSRRAVGGGKQ